MLLSTFKKFVSIVLFYILIFKSSDAYYRSFAGLVRRFSNNFYNSDNNFRLHSNLKPVKDVDNIKKYLHNTVTSTLIGLSGLTIIGGANAEDAIITRADVGFINLNETEPIVTDICWFDIKIGDADPQRVEISLYGKVAPITCTNFKSLCVGDAGWGYKNSDIFRVISTFSVQGGNIGQPDDAKPAQISRYGKAGAPTNGQPFLPENFRILHSYRDAGVVSMMKDITNKGMQDSRFFITTNPYASWADEKYVAFGRVSKGMNVIEALQVVPVKAPANYPLSRIQIADSGCY